MIFAIGLFKKTVIADTAGEIADPLFGAAMHASTFDGLGGWVAAVFLYRSGLF